MTGRAIYSANFFSDRPGLADRTAMESPLEDVDKPILNAEDNARRKNARASVFYGETRARGG